MNYIPRLLGSLGIIRRIPLGPTVASRAPAGGMIPEKYDVRTIRLVPGSGSIAHNLVDLFARSLVDPSKLAKSPEHLVNALTRVEDQYGTVTAFVLGALVISGVTDRQKIVDYGQQAGRLIQQVAAAIKSKGAGASARQVEDIKAELWQLAPNRYSRPGRVDNYRLPEALDKYLDRSGEQIGDCVTLTLIDNLVLSGLGLAVGVVMNPAHVYSLFGDGLTIENTISNYRAASERHENDDRVGRNYNYLGLLAVLANGRGNHLAVAEGNSAEHWYDLAIALCPNYATSYNNRANYFCDRNEYAKAARDYQAAVELDSENAYAYVNRSVLYFKLGRMADALSDIRTAFRLDPHNPDFAGLFKQFGFSSPVAPGMPR